MPTKTLAGESLRLPGVGTALRELRERAGLSAATLAEQIGIDQSTLSKYENGRRAVPLGVLENIAEALGQPPVAVVAWCLKKRFPELAEPKTKIARLLSELEIQVAKQCPSI